MTTKTSSYNDVLDSARAKLRAAFDASPELQAEFVCAEDYAAFSLAERPTSLDTVFVRLSPPIVTVSIPSVADTSNTLGFCFFTHASNCLRALCTPAVVFGFARIRRSAAAIVSCPVLTASPVIKGCRSRVVWIFATAENPRPLQLE